MERWILLAAAGSGYLAHRWQNLQKSKEASSDKSDDDDDDHSGSSSRTLSSRRRYCLLSSSSRRLKASSNQNWLVSKFSNSVGKVTDGSATHLHVDDEEMDEDQNGVILDSCSHAKTPTQFQTGLDAASSYPTNALHTFNAFCERKCFGFDFFHKNQEGCGLMSAEAFPDSLDCSTTNWYSAHCTGDTAMDGSGSMPRNESPVKLIYNVLDNDMASEEEAFPYGPWMPRYQNAFEDTSVLETSTSFPMQEYEGRSSINTRKVRSHLKNGRSRCFTRRSRSLEGCLPITSSESCSSVHVDDEHSQDEDNIHFSAACEQSFDGLGEHLGNELAAAIISDNPLSEENHGFISPPRNEVLNKRRKSESLGEKAVESTHFPCLPLQSNKRGRVKACRECSASPGGDNFLLQGSANSLLKALLFNFGVGVGMMFTMLSTKHGTKQLIRPLEETLCSLKSLEDEVHGRTKLMLECLKKKGAREDDLTEQIDALFEVVRRIFDAVKHVRNSLSQDLACISATDHKHSKERARLEAELEAELERMEMNLITGDVLERCRRYSGVSEDDLNIGNLIQGELSTRGIPCDAEADSVSDDSGDSCYEVTHYGNFGVPPVELAKRLRAVLEARQEREILELEAEVKLLDGRLQATQEELKVWKQKALHPLQGSICESFSSFQEKGVCVNAVETSEKVPFSSRAEEPCCFSVGMHHSTLDSSVSLGCNEHISSNCTKEVCSLHLRVPQPRTCLSDESDDEGSEEISHLLSDTATGSPSALQNGLFKSAHAKDNGNRGMPLHHQELESTCFSNDATDDTLDSTTCLVKFVDGHTILHHHLEDKLDGKVGMDASSRKKHSNIDWNGEVVPISKDVSFIQDKPAVCTQDVIEISETYGQFRYTSDWSTSEDGSYSSDLDEKLGQLLIKRIVEKSKRGSSIIEVAQSVMASFDIDETE